MVVIGLVRKILIPEAAMWLTDRLLEWLFSHVLPRKLSMLSSQKSLRDLTDRFVVVVESAEIGLEEDRIKSVFVGFKGLEESEVDDA